MFSHYRNLVFHGCVNCQNFMIYGQENKCTKLQNSRNKRTKLAYVLTNNNLSPHNNLWWKQCGCLVLSNIVQNRKNKLLYCALFRKKECQSCSLTFSIYVLVLCEFVISGVSEKNKDVEIRPFTCLLV